MNRANCRCARAAPCFTLAGLTFGLVAWAPGWTRADTLTSYKIQLIAQLGDKVGGATINTNGHFAVDALNDRGQLVFGADSGKGELLAEYTGGSFKPIVLPGQPGPSGVWPGNVMILDPASINQRGDITFATAPYGTPGTAYPGTGTYLWEDQTQQITVVAMKGMPATGHLTFQDGGTLQPTINNRDEIAFPAQVAGRERRGIFLRSPDGQLQPVALPDDPRPDGGKIGDAIGPVINDAGVVVFGADVGSNVFSEYVWEKGVLTPVLVVGAAAPGGGKIVDATYAWVNDKNRNVLVEARPTTQRTSTSNLYLWSNGTVTPVAVPGQEMPGGGQFSGMQIYGPPISFANEAGQHAFIAQLKDHSTAAYRMDADGTLSLILKSGTTTDLGTITQVGSAFGGPVIALNSAGQVAVSVSIAGRPDAVVLLTPIQP